MTEEKIKRINELAKKSKDGTLSSEEKQEQINLRREYIDTIKGNLKSQLEKIEIVDEQKNDR